ncbi:PIG-L deacetylase family protein [Granulosicoccus antarcticus]|uniref:N-acetyl-alpha-D-glucosaminyl L-malate deacetylase 1 n=1 Tax=Granulosicoccus antarcticus IMCC3135 TaxID=1192854 RepID=A0A2Z2NTW8_9GAMM|nr:PIG-L family deacetylase [Granulosicoccus antarcticus]ASJ74926.1 N-acetyl-alpha-D-glucosaminyl L-malate deacetylase 1 [Granulosicoccus antarcticus IMCC3135]
MNILLIAPHPDDEILGCGGTLLRHKHSGDSIHIVFVTTMQEAHGFSSERIQSRAAEIACIQRELGASIYQLPYPTATLTDSDTLSLIPELSTLFKSISPEMVYLPNRSDAHSDHGVSFNAAYACTKVFRYPSIKTIMMYETISETDFSPALPENIFVPNYFVDISSFMEQKLELMKVYASELAEHPFPRSIKALKALGTLRGSAAGVEYAEAFQLIKHIR